VFTERAVQVLNLILGGLVFLYLSLVELIANFQEGGSAVLHLLEDSPVL